eukprot:CAMPEP_0202054212 /NCGR_PEP_ID=MMETSP0963-20130614/6351_1 /ASSEMBLY_ACC=CAM_ASM_000494 /TAXON_ID=4773 /ORGANISM="Schizochytrium aggregatum, Strain ATCC28209" /LENGTH=44 /DNA_ID= /DNA_START= /DNA_END= /DNA_ORIENTATION=
MALLLSHELRRKAQPAQIDLCSRPSDQCRAFALDEQQFGHSWNE